MELNILPSLLPRQVLFLLSTMITMGVETADDEEEES